MRTHLQVIDLLSLIGLGY